MINMGRVVSNPRFTQTVTVYRKSGSYGAGGFTQTETPITMQAVVTLPDSNDLTQLPEGDQNEGTITLYTTQTLYQTTTSGTSDEVSWNGVRYRVMKVWLMQQYGYTKAMATRMSAV